MTEKESIQQNSQAVQSHLTILQSVIQRMSANSTSCKTWCITLVSAILIVVADKDKSQYAWLAAFPTTLFFLLDAYYLSLERGFRNAYNAFIEKLHGQDLRCEHLFVVTPRGGRLCLFFESICSLSVWPFYVALVVMIYMAKELILN